MTHPPPRHAPRVDAGLAPAPEWARALLAAGRVARLATVDGDGQPSVVAVCYVLAGDRLYTPIDGKRKRTSRVEGGRLRRLRDLEANPRIALVVDRWDEDWRNLAWVSVRGRGRALVAAEADHADLADLVESAGGAKTSDVKTSDDSERRAAIAALRAKYPQYGGGAEGASLADGATVIRIEIEESRWWRSRRSPEEES